MSAEGCGDGVGEPGVWCYERVVVQRGTGHAIATGDFNGDGRSDLVVWDTIAGELRVLVWDVEGMPTLGPPVASSQGGGTSHLLSADVNGDGIDDAIVASTSSLRVHQGLGSGELGTGDEYEAACAGLAYPTQPFRLDGDAAAEFVVGCGHDVLILQWVNDQLVRVGDAIPASSCPVSSIAIGDLDADGIDDVVVGGACAQYVPEVPVTVLRGTGSGLEPAQPYTGGPNGALAMAVADFGGDGHLDAAVSNLGVNQLHLLRGLGDASLAALDPLALECDAACNVPSQAWTLAAADLDGDGDSELLAEISGSLERQGLYWIHDPSSAAVPVWVEDTAGILAIGDYNTDGWPDIAYTIRDGDQHAVVVLASNP